MVFLGIYRAIYDYVPQSDNELPLTDGDLLMVLEKSTDDDWWRAKKKAQGDDDVEPEGLIPNNYVEEVMPTKKAKALYDYTRQTDEELSFKESAVLDVYDTSDPDWTLVGVNGDYGFAPSNYIDLDAADDMPAPSPPLPARPAAPQAPPAPAIYEDEEPEPESPVQSPAAALAGIIQKKSEQQAQAPRAPISPPPNVSAAPPRRVQFTPETEDDEEVPPPRLPARPPSEQFSPPPTRVQFATPRSPSPPARSTPPPRSVTFDQYDPQPEQAPHTPLSGSGYHLYNVYEYITQPGKNKKMPVTFGINIPRGSIMLAPEKARDGQQQEWTADNLEYYSQEGKHVFLELKRPSKSVDLHCGAKDTASEIVTGLGELSGAAKASGLREVLAAGSGTSNVQKKGHMLFDHMAAGDDEVSVATGEEVLIIDDSASNQWWKVRRLKTGKEGLVPADYVEVTETIPLAGSASHSARSGVNAGRSRAEQNRLEEEELTRQAVRNSRRSDSDATSDQRSKRDSSAPSKDSKSSSKPDPKNMRTWTDRTNSFKVEAEFLTLKDGKIHLHKFNGVKIAVPIAKMSVADLEYIERVTGVSLDDDKPLSDIKRRSTQRLRDSQNRSSSAGITIDKKPKYDWFDFFLKCGVNPQICERYTQSFERDQMGEENLPDVNEKVLRTLGVKEGDILRVMKFLDNKFGRTGDKRSVSFAENSEEGSGGLFSGPGGVLRNNTRKGRPAPPVQTNDVVDPKAFEVKEDGSKKPADATTTPLASAPKPEEKVEQGFEDNAWEVKPSRQPAKASPPPAENAPPPAAAPATSAAAPAPAPAAPAPPLTGALGELSLLDMPALKPEIPEPKPAAAAPAPAQQPALTVPQGPQGANASLFDQVAALKSMPASAVAPPRLRPQAPQQTGPGGLIAPPPQRSSSAPQNPMQSAFGPPPPLQPQHTGYVAPPHMHAQIAPPGQSLQALSGQMTGFPGQGVMGFQPGQNGMNGMNGMMSQPTGMGMGVGMAPQPTGFGGMTSPPPQQRMQTGFGQAPMAMQQMPMATGFAQQQTVYQQPQPTGFAGAPSPFADPRGIISQPTGMGIAPQPTGYNTFAPSPLNPQATGINRFLPPAIPPAPPMPSGGGLAPLIPQKTGPPPPVRFGVPAAKKLTPQPTGRADLSKATPQNPFGF